MCSLSFERLEDRVLLAVAVKQSGANLTITSDNDGDFIQVYNNARVQGSVDVFVDGEGYLGRWSNVQNLRIDGKGGADVLWLYPTLDLTGSLTIDAGAGEDSIDLEGTFGKNLTVKLGGNDKAVDYFQFGDLSVGGNAKIDGGEGGTYIRSYGTAVFDGNLTVNTGKVYEEIHLGHTFVDGNTYESSVAVGGNLKINAGAGNDVVELGPQLVVEGNADVNLGAGDDRLTSYNVDVAGKFNVNAGGGIDLLDSDLIPRAANVKLNSFEIYVAAVA